MSIVTFIILKLVKIDNVQYFSGIMLLISGGSFLNVSTMHILPEALSGGNHSLGHSQLGLSVNQLLTLCASVYLPVLLSVEVRSLEI
jgi:hypothetical protein